MDFSCACGFKTLVKDEWAGRKVKCPKCGRSVCMPLRVSVPQVPHADAPEIVDDFLSGETKTTRAAKWGLCILIAVGVTAVSIGPAFGGEDNGFIPAAGLCILSVTLVYIIGLVPGYIARGKQRHKDIRILGLWGIIIPIVWLFAFIWAFVDKPANHKKQNGNN